MRKHILAGLAMMATGLVTTVVAQNQGFRVSGRQLLDANGNEFIMRGVNHPHAWYASQLNTALPAIAATGANVVRVVMATGGRWNRTSSTEVRDIIAALKANHLIGILEVHDCTGYDEQSGSVPLSQAVDYWLASDIMAEITGQEAYIIVNIANEPFGNSITADTYINEHKTAITRLREGGLKHALMVDAANWGQDWANTMRNRAGEILAEDPDGNIIFSVHMYDVYDTDAKVNTYLQTLYNNNIATVVGEFAADHGANKPVAAQAILNRTHQYNQGYLGWSWKGNSSGLESLDIAINWDGSSLTAWGEILVNGANGLKTATKATVYTQITPTSSAQISSSSQPFSSSSVVSSSSQPLSSAVVSSSSVGIPATGGVSGFEIWGVYVDAIGSTVSPAAGSSPVFSEGGNNVARASFTIVPEPTWVEGAVLDYPYVGMLMEFRENSAVQNITGATGITLTYSSAGAVRLSLNQAGMTAGQEWGIVLPPSANFTTITIPFAQLEQPSWITTATPLNLAQLIGIKWELKETAGGAGHIAISSLQFPGWAGGSVAIQSPVMASNSLAMVRGVAQGNLLLDLQLGGITVVELFDGLGQLRWSYEAELGAGAHAIALPTLAPGLHIARVRQGAHAQARPVHLR